MPLEANSWAIVTVKTPSVLLDPPLAEEKALKLFRLSVAQGLRRTTWALWPRLGSHNSKTVPQIAHAAG